MKVKIPVMVYAFLLSCTSVISAMVAPLPEVIAYSNPLALTLILVVAGTAGILILALGFVVVGAELAVISCLDKSSTFSPHIAPPTIWSVYGIPPPSDWSV